MLLGFGKNLSSRGRIHATLERNNESTRWRVQEEDDEYDYGSETDDLEELQNDHDDSCRNSFTLKCFFRFAHHIHLLFWSVH